MISENCQPPAGTYPPLRWLNLTSHDIRAAVDAELTAAGQSVMPRPEPMTLEDVSDLEVQAVVIDGNTRKDRLCFATYLAGLLTPVVYIGRKDGAARDFNESLGRLGIYRIGNVEQFRRFLENGHVYTQDKVSEIGIRKTDTGQAFTDREVDLYGGNS